MTICKSTGFISLLVLATLTACGGGGGGSAVSFTPPPAQKVPRFAYAANSGDNTVSIYTVNADTGKLRHNGYALTGTSPQSVTVDPSGKFAYVANYGSNTVSGYKINNATGALDPIGSSPTGTNPYSVTIDPSGKFVYVANFGAASVSAYTIDGTTGALTQIDADSGTPGVQNFPSGSQPLSVIIDASGKFAFTATNGGQVSAYTINPGTGALTSAGTVTTGEAMRSVAVDPSGKYVYVAATLNFGHVLAYSVNATTGALSPVAGSPFSTGNFPIAVAVDPSGKFVYVANYSSASVSQFSIDPGTGALNSMGAVGVGANPSSRHGRPFGQIPLRDEPGLRYRYDVHHHARRLEQPRHGRCPQRLRLHGRDQGYGSGCVYAKVRVRGKLRLQQRVNVHHQRCNWRPRQCRYDDYDKSPPHVRRRRSFWQVRVHHP